MKKNKNMTVLLSGALSMLFTIILYFLISDDVFGNTIVWLSMLILLLIEAVATMKAYKSEMGIFSITTVFSSVAHFVVILLVSLVFIADDSLMIRTYLLWNLLIAVAVALVDVVILYFGGKAVEANKSYANSASVIEACYTKAQAILMDCESSEYKEGLRNIAEGLQYGNKSKLCGNEMDILSKLEELHGLIKVADKSIMEPKMKEIQTLIKMRAIQTKKSGNF